MADRRRPPSAEQREWLLAAQNGQHRELSDAAIAAQYQQAWADDGQPAFDASETLTHTPGSIQDYTKILRSNFPADLIDDRGRLREKGQFRAVKECADDAILVASKLEVSQEEFRLICRDPARYRAFVELAQAPWWTDSVERDEWWADSAVSYLNPAIRNPQALWEQALLDANVRNLHEAMRTLERWEADEIERHRNDADDLVTERIFLLKFLGKDFARDVLRCSRAIGRCYPREMVEVVGQLKNWGVRTPVVGLCLYCLYSWLVIIVDSLAGSIPAQVLSVLLTPEQVLPDIPEQVLPDMPFEEMFIDDEEEKKDPATNLNECNSFPCLNGGVCTDGDFSYTCDCADGFIGDDCEDDVAQTARDIEAFEMQLRNGMGAPLETDGASSPTADSGVFDTLASSVLEGFAWLSDAEQRDVVCGLKRTVLWPLCFLSAIWAGSWLVGLVRRRGIDSVASCLSCCSSARDTASTCCTSLLSVCHCPWRPAPADSDCYMELTAFLQSVQLERQRSVLIDNEVTFDSLLEFTEADLKELGIAKGPRVKMIRTMKRFDRTAAAAVEAPAAATAAGDELPKIHTSSSSTTVVPNEFLCPISQEIMTEPVIVEGVGQTYEKQEIQKWFRTSQLDPVSGANIGAQRKLTPNLALKKMIADWNEKNPAVVV
jgi:hypothetical protein